MKKQLLTALLLMGGMVALHAQTTITNYTTGDASAGNSFNNGAGWTTGDPWQGQNSWNGSGSGGSSIDTVPGYTTPGAGNNSGTMGVYDTPTSAPVSLNQGFTPMSTAAYNNITVSFTTEWAVLDLGIASPWNDGFEFNLNAGGVSALAFEMRAPGGLGDYAIRTGTGPLSNMDNLFYDIVYRMQIDMTGTTWTGTVWVVNDPLITASFGGTLRNGLSASDVNNLEVNWILDSGDVGQLGSQGLVVNEFSITSKGDPIPEASTWAMGALLLGGLVVTVYRRRKAAASVEMAA